jgi:hypothetical protein
MWKLVLVCLETVLVSMQDSWMAYAKRTIGLEMLFDVANATPR